MSLVASVLIFLVGVFILADADFLRGFQGWITSVCCHPPERPGRCALLDGDDCLTRRSVFLGSCDDGLFLGLGQKGPMKSPRRRIALDSRSSGVFVDRNW